MFAQMPTPAPVTPNPTIPIGGGSGGYMNPANYTGLAHELGPAWFVLLAFTVLLFLACCYMVWRSWKQPSNASQLAFLRAMYKTSNARHAQWQASMRVICSILAAIAKKNEVDLNGKLDDLREALAAPPPLPDNLLTLFDENSAKDAHL